MVLYNFKAIRVVPDAKDFIDIVLSKTQRGTPTVVHNGWAITRIRQFYTRKVIAPPPPSAVPGHLACARPRRPCRQHSRLVCLPMRLLLVWAAPRPCMVLGWQALTFHKHQLTFHKPQHHRERASAELTEPARHVLLPAGEIRAAELARQAISHPGGISQGADVAIRPR